MAEYAATTRYRSHEALSYDNNRTKSCLNRRRWQGELKAIDAIMSRLPSGLRVLDMPCGTGRFFPILAKHGCCIHGADISQDMIDCIPPSILDGCPNISLAMADATNLAYPQRSFDYVLCMRFFNIVPDVVRTAALQEFVRVASEGVIIQVRFRGLMGPLLAFSNMTRRLFHRAKALLSPETPSYAPRASSMRPSLKEFKRITSACGLDLVQIYPIWWGITLSPMTVCLLRTKHASKGDQGE